MFKVNDFRNQGDKTWNNYLKKCGQLFIKHVCSSDLTMRGKK